MRARRIDALTEFDEGGAAPDGRLIDERRTRWAPSLRTKVQESRVCSLGPKLGPCDMRLQAQKIYRHLKAYDVIFLEDFLRI